MNDRLKLAVETLRRKVQEAVGEFGSAIINEPEITYCQEAADVLEEQAECLRNREQELATEEE